MGRIFENVDTAALEQRTPEWFTARSRYLVTGSRFDTALRTPGHYGSAPQLWRETVGLEPPRIVPSSEAMRWGTEHEADAIAAFTKMTGLKTRPIGLVPIGRTLYAVSPDAVVTDASGEADLGLLEVKCPFSRPITDDLPARYTAQVAGYLAALQYGGYQNRHVWFCQWNAKEARCVRYDQSTLLNWVAPGQLLDRLDRFVLTGDGGREKITLQSSYRWMT